MPLLDISTVETIENEGREMGNELRQKFSTGIILGTLWLIVWHLKPLDLGAIVAEVNPWIACINMFTTVRSN